MGNPQKAAQVLEEIVQKENFLSTGHYAYAGMAKWIIECYDEAIELWKAGRKAQYADAAGGMELPLLIYYAAVRKPKLIRVSEATKLLREQLRHPWASCWPGPLGAYVLDDISEGKIRELAVFTHEEVTRQRTLQVEFYVGVKAEQLGDRAKFVSQMKRCASSPGCESETELYLARHEFRFGLAYPRF